VIADFTVVREAVSKIDASALRPEIGHFKFSLGKTPCTSVSGSIFKRGNAASADFRGQPEGPGPFPFSRILSLFVVHLARLNLSPLASSYAKMVPGALPSIFETASTLGLFYAI
jgi:hypothetical protein